MEPKRAAEHLQVIRTLMERTAIYRRALKPLMFMLGSLGILAAIGGWGFGIEATRSFGSYWMAVGLLAISLAFVMVRREAFRDGEPIWSPPTRRVAQAAAPPLFVGGLTSLLLIGSMGESLRQGWSLLPVWMTLYGCAMHAAGFFMPRGIKLFGWFFIASGLGVAALLTSSVDLFPLRYAHGVMGLFFGGVHLGYGVYLELTGQRKNET